MPGDSWRIVSNSLSCGAWQTRATNTLAPAGANAANRVRFCVPIGLFSGGGSSNRNGNVAKKRSKGAARAKKKDPIFVDGKRPRPMYIDYKDLELLSKLTSRHGRMVSRRKSGCTAVSQHAVAKAIKRARFMALLPYVAE